MRGMGVWDAHPKVYLSIAETGDALCPYCSAHYQLTDFTPDLTQNDKTSVEHTDEPIPNL